MRQNRLVNIDLYKILEDGEVKANTENGEAVLYALINFYNLRDFTELMGENYFCEGGIDVELHDGYIAIRIDEIIEEIFDNEIESYREAIGEYEYNEYIEYKKDIEKTKQDINKGWR